MHQSSQQFHLWVIKMKQPHPLRNLDLYISSHLWNVPPGVPLSTTHLQKMQKMLPRETRWEALSCLEWRCRTSFVFLSKLFSSPHSSVVFPLFHRGTIGKVYFLWTHFCVFVAFDSRKIIVTKYLLPVPSFLQSREETTGKPDTLSYNEPLARVATLAHTHTQSNTYVTSIMSGGWEYAINTASLLLINGTISSLGLKFFLRLLCFMNL